VYCGSECRKRARQISCKEANKRHQKSEEGRKDHLYRMVRYRAKKKKMTDQSAENFTLSVTVDSATGASCCKEHGDDDGAGRHSDGADISDDSAGPEQGTQCIDGPPYLAGAGAGSATGSRRRNSAFFLFARPRRPGLGDASPAAMFP
jgi:hypothetical protein